MKEGIAERASSPELEHYRTTKTPKLESRLRLWLGLVAGGHHRQLDDRQTDRQPGFGGNFLFVIILAKIYLQVRPQNCFSYRSWGDAKFTSEFPWYYLDVEWATDNTPQISFLSRQFIAYLLDEYFAKLIPQRETVNISGCAILNELSCTDGQMKSNSNNNKVVAVISWIYYTYCGVGHNINLRLLVLDYICTSSTSASHPSIQATILWGAKSVTALLYLYMVLTLDSTVLIT